MSTKLETIKQVSAKLGGYDLKPALVIDALEQLGLIKFDPPLDPIIEMMIDAEQAFNDKEALKRGGCRTARTQQRIEEFRAARRPILREKMQVLRNVVDHQYRYANATMLAEAAPGEMFDSSAWTGRGGRSR